MPKWTGSSKTKKKVGLSLQGVLEMLPSMFLGYWPVSYKYKPPAGREGQAGHVTASLSFF